MNPSKMLFDRLWHSTKAHALAAAGYDPESHEPVGPTPGIVLALAKGRVENNAYVPVESTGYYFGTFRDLGEVVEFFNSDALRRVKGSLSFFEVMLNRSPQRVAFDLEYVFAKPSHAEVGEKLLGASRDKAIFVRVVFVERVLPWLSSLAQRAVTSEECQCLDASNDEKLSLHIVVDKLFIPAGCLGQFRDAARCVFKGILHPLLDLGVYMSMPMRLVGCTKVGQNRTLLPVDRVGDVTFGATPTFDGMFTEELLKRHMWTHVPDGAVALGGLGAAPLSPRATRLSRPSRGGRVTPEALAALEPYIARAGFLDGDLFLFKPTETAYLFKFKSTQTCPFCEERPHLKQGYKLIVWLGDGSMGNVVIKPWSADCRGGARSHAVGPPISIAALGYAEGAGPTPGLEPVSHSVANPAPVAPPVIHPAVDLSCVVPVIHSAAPRVVDPEPSPELESFLLRLLGGYDWDGRDLLQFSYAVVDGAWTLRTHQNWYTPLFPPGSLDYCVHVEDGKGRVVLTRGVRRLVVASFPVAYVPHYLRSVRLSGVPFHEPDPFVPTLERYFGTNVIVTAASYRGEVPPHTTLLFNAVVGAARLCAVSGGRLHVRELIDRPACAGPCCASLSLDDRTRCDSRVVFWVPVDDGAAVTRLAAAFERVYGQQLARVGAVPTGGGRCTIEVLNLTDVYPWHHAVAIAVEEPVDCAGVSVAFLASETGAELRARMARAIAARSDELDAVDVERVRAAQAGAAAAARSRKRKIDDARGRTGLEGLVRAMRV